MTKLDSMDDGTLPLSRTREPEDRRPWKLGDKNYPGSPGIRGSVDVDSTSGVSRSHDREWRYDGLNSEAEHRF